MHKAPSKTAAWLMQLAKFLAAMAENQNNARKQARDGLIRSVFKFLLDLSGFAFLTWSGFQVNSVAGGIVAGLSCFIMSRHFGGKAVVIPPDPTMRTS